MAFPPGFRFYPTEEELVSFYLHHKQEGGRDHINQMMDRLIPVLDIYHYNPWDLPQVSGDLCSLRDPEQWFFFVPRQESEARGGRPKRLTNAGYWKATGSPGQVYSNNRIIGMKRTMVFYLGRAPNGRKSEWKMNEYKAIDQADHASSSSSSANHKLRDEFSLCRLYKKSKCLRAFDRRPVGAEVGEAATAAQPACSANNNEATTSYQNQLPMVERAISSPPESSSSGDQGNIRSQTGPSSNKPMSSDIDSLWDLDSIGTEEDMINLQLD